MLQAQIFQDLSAPGEKQNLLSCHPEFNILSSLPPELEGVSESALLSQNAMEATEDEALQQQVAAGNVPSTETIYR